jgi:hypothetical protein
MLGEETSRHAQVEALQAELHECMESVEANEQAVLLMIADGIAAGTIEAGKVKSGVEAVNTSASSIHTCVAGPLNRLYALLLPPERAELGDKVRAHWAVWKQVNIDAPPQGKGPGSHLADLKVELKLSAEQVEKLSTALQTAFTSSPLNFDSDRVNKQVDAFAKALVGKGFDATKVTTNSTAYLTAHATNRMALFYETITPLLNADQRTTLAAHLREHANHHPTAEASPGGRP